MLIGSLRSACTMKLHTTPMVDLHARARGVEDARHLIANGEAPSVIGKQGSRPALASP
jgi:hypothetical protein